MKKLVVMFSGFIKYRDLLLELVARDIKIRYRRSVLGLLWTLLNPILMMTVMTLVFSGLFRFDIENFPIYFFTGHILFTFLIESTNNGLHSIIESSSLIKSTFQSTCFIVKSIIQRVNLLLYSHDFVMIATVSNFIQQCYLPRSLFATCWYLPPD